jgi:chemotaxis signal transduction protein
VSVVTFWLGENEFAFDLADVVEMTLAQDLTHLPGTTPRVAGVTTWRGRTIPVIDLRALLKLEDSPPDVKKRLLVLDRPGPFAVLVERPGRILAAGETSPVAADDEEGARSLMVSLARTDQGLVRILDPARLVGDDQDLLAGGPRSAGEPAR